MMCRILVVDDTPFWRDVVSDALRLKKHSVVTASSAAEALAILGSRPIDLITLDVDMPQVQGLSFLEQIRRDARWKDLPVIMLTGDMQKDHVLLAKKLGAVDYLLKARFSPAELLERIRKQLEYRESQGGTSSVAAVAPASTSAENLPILLTRDNCLARAKHAMSGRTLAGVVADVISSASSPRIDLADLANSIGRDAILAARVLQASNSAMNVSARGAISTLPDAVRIIGCTGIRNIAASVGVFDAMPQSENDGFDPIRSWQHSLGVATLCDRLAPAELKTSAYLVGLCHDLGEILFRTHFGKEYRQLLEVHATSGLPMYKLEIQMLGAAQGEIAEEILKTLGLPEGVSRPINLFHHAVRTNTILTDPLARVLQIADSYATGALLAASENGMVRPYSQGECRQCTGQTNPPRPDDLQLRGEIMALTSVYARLSPKETRKSGQPLFPRDNARLFVVRDQALSSFDPITSALETMANVTVGPALPPVGELAGYNGIVVIARSLNSMDITPADMQEYVHASGTSLPVLLLEGKKDDVSASKADGLIVAHWPISIADLAMFIQGVCHAKEAA